MGDDSFAVGGRGMTVRIQSSTKVENAGDSSRRIDESGRFHVQILNFEARIQGSRRAVLWIQRSSFAREFERAVTRRSCGELERELRRVRKIRSFDVYLVVGVGFRVSARIANNDCSILEREALDRKVRAGATGRAARACSAGTLGLALAGSQS